MKLAYYLKKNQSDGTGLICVVVHFNGERIRTSFGERIAIKKWDANKQRVKNVNSSNSDGSFILNDLLNGLEKHLERKFREWKLQGFITGKHVLAEIKEFIKDPNGDSENQAKSSLYELISRFIAGEIKSMGKDRAKLTLTGYKNTFNHLKRFEKMGKYQVDFDTINIDFYYRFINYMQNQGLGINSIGKQIKNIKVFMGEAIDLGLTTNLAFKNKKFTCPSEETESVALTETEILNLFKLDLSNNKRLEQVRDLFVFGCFTGLRFSDFSRIKEENIVSIDEDYFIKVQTQKTDEQVIIPCNPIVVNILEKYNKRDQTILPRAISNQKFNNYIKEVCQTAGLKEKGRLSSDLNSELWECISSHTARRSFATMTYLSGFPVFEIMKITGHRSEKSFLNYIKVGKLQTAKRLSEHIKKNWSSLLVRVAS